MKRSSTFRRHRNKWRLRFRAAEAPLTDNAEKQVVALPTMISGCSHLRQAGPLVAAPFWQGGSSRGGHLRRCPLPLGGQGGEDVAVAIGAARATRARRWVSVSSGAAGALSVATVARTRGRGRQPCRRGPSARPECGRAWIVGKDRRWSALGGGCPQAAEVFAHPRRQPREVGCSSFVGSRGILRHQRDSYAG